MIVCTAPARANLIGNPSDQYGGCTLACTVPLRARVEIAPASALVLESAGESFEVGSGDGLRLRGDRFDLARAVLRALGGGLPALRVAYDSEIPMHSGMGGSSALVVALLRGLLAARGHSAAPHVLAEIAREIERSEMGITCGYVDQYLAVFGGLRYVDFRGKTPEGSAATEPFASAELLALDGPLPFRLAFTGVRHSSDSVHRPIRERWLRGDSDVHKAYARVDEIGRAGKRALLLGDWPTLGALMNENHAIQRELGGSGESNERLIAAAHAAGAHGAKLAGAGDGGTIVALHTGDAADLDAALRGAGAEALYTPEPIAGVEVRGV